MANGGQVGETPHSVTSKSSYRSNYRRDRVMTCLHQNISGLDCTDQPSFSPTEQNNQLWKTMKNVISFALWRRNDADFRNKNKLRTLRKSLVTRNNLVETQDLRPFFLLRVTHCLLHSHSHANVNIRFSFVSSICVVLKAASSVGLTRRGSDCLVSI